MADGWDDTETQMLYHLETYEPSRKGQYKKYSFYVGIAMILKHFFGKEQDYGRPEDSQSPLRLKIEEGREAGKLPPCEAMWGPNSYPKEVIHHIAMKINQTDNEALHADILSTLKPEGIDPLPKLEDIEWLRDYIKKSSIAWSDKTRFGCHLLYTWRDPRDSLSTEETPLRLPFDQLKERMFAFLPIKDEESRFINEKTVEHCVTTLITSLPISGDGPKQLKWFKRELGGSRPNFKSIRDEFKVVYNLKVEDKNDIVDRLVSLN